MAEDNKKTILVVEDDLLNMRLTVDLLELYGFKTLSFFDGKSALAALENTRPDLILLDIGLPGMDGYEIHKRIREDKRFDGIKIVALSAAVMKEDVEKMTACGFNAVIPKPIDTKGLIKRIKDFLNIQ
jgi:two-component system cell cycle response regulator DivK